MGLCTGRLHEIKIWSPKNLTEGEIVDISAQETWSRFAETDHELVTTLAWILSRYLELALFKYLQHSLNGRDKRSTEKTKADTKLIFDILMIKDSLTSKVCNTPLQEHPIQLLG